MENVYWAYYRPSFSEAYQSCMMQLLQCPDAAEWWFRTRLPAWMFKSRANSFIREAISSPTSLKTQLAGIYNMQRLARFDVARGYLSRGFSHITQDDVAPHQYITGIERGYSTYLKYLNQMLTEFSAAGVEVYIQIPWPESRKNEEGFIEVLDYYWDLIKTVNYEGSNVHFLDEIYFWPNENFVDPLHLNHPGAIRLSRELVSRIATKTNHFKTEN